MEPENNKNELSIQEQLEMQQQALAKIYQSVEKTRKYIFWTAVFNIVLLVVPLIILVIMLPKIMNTFTGSMNMFMDANESGTFNQESLEESFNRLRELF